MHASRISGKGKLLLYYRDSAKIQNLDCPAAGRHVPMAAIDEQVGDLVKRLQLPDDWRERLEELASHQEERENVEAQRRYVQGKMRRLRELYLDGDFAKAEYDRRKADLQAQLDALQVPQQPAIEAAGETLESLGAEWASAPKRYQRDMLRVIFEAVYMDPLARCVVCVKPWPQFAPLFRMDGLREKEGCFYVGEEDQEARSED